jgi:hypothetical protein
MEVVVEFDVKKVVIEVICSSCNKAFNLRNVDRNENNNTLTTSFEDCPHCGARTDIWLLIKHN